MPNLDKTSCIREGFRSRSRLIGPSQRFSLAKLSATASLVLEVLSQGGEFCRESRHEFGQWKETRRKAQVLATGSYT